MENRKANFDLLRIVCTIAVICIHVAGKYVDAIDSGDWLGAPYTAHMLFNCIFNVTARFAVPCFIMLSGAFTLSNEKMPILSFITTRFSVMSAFRLYCSASSILLIT